NIRPGGVGYSPSADSSRGLPPSREARSTLPLLYSDPEARHEPLTQRDSVGVHVDRAAGGDRHHRDPDRPARPRRPAGPLGRRPPGPPPPASPKTPQRTPPGPRPPPRPPPAPARPGGTSGATSSPQGAARPGPSLSSRRATAARRSTPWPPTPCTTSCRGG